MAMLTTSAAPPRAIAEDLLVSSAISLKEALLDVSAQFEKAHPGCHVVLNGAASGELARQIQKGAPVDIFVSASPLEMQILKREKLLASDPRPLAFNRLVVVAAANAAPIHSLGELAFLQKIAVGNPQSAPVGRYAEQAMKKAGVFAQLQQKHRLIFGMNARALVTYAEQNNVDAAFVYLTDVVANKQVTVPFIVPKNMTEPIVCEISAISNSAHKKLAGEFIEFALSAPSLVILSKHHFEKSWN